MQNARTRRRARIVALVIAAAVTVALAGSAIATVLLVGAPGPAKAWAATFSSATPNAPAPYVRGSELIDGRTGEPLALWGANVPGFEYACIQGRGHDDGGTTADAVAAMVEWGFTAVRIPLNQQCWGVDRPSVAFGTADDYRANLERFVTLATDTGLVVIVDLHWSAPGGEIADGLRAMPDANSVTFWNEVAADYRKHRAVIFDAFNEPHSRYDAGRQQWAFELTPECWRDGRCRVPREIDRASAVSGATFTASGMADLVAAVRASGARQPVIVSGLDYANDLRAWVDHRPADEQLIAGVHLYPEQRCRDVECWQTELGPVAQAAPLLVAEFGQSDGGSEHLDAVLDWARGNAVGALAWAWWVIDDPTASEDARYALIADDAFTPNHPSGTTLRAALDSLP